MPVRRGFGSGAGEYKMVLVVRGELRLTPGKAAAQVAHAAVMLYQAAEKRDPETLAGWLGQGQRKIVLVAPTLPDMEELARKARAQGVSIAWVEDAGLTEVAPGTRTCLGLGPGFAAHLDPITGKLDLL